MDFGKLLSVAKQNTSSEGQNAEGRYYSTKFAPPKKESKEKKLSDNIKKFLAKKEEEEREKALEARRKADELMAKRDTKAKRKIEKMLKVIKSANKSVLSDAGGKLDSGEPEQPDEDDYGYTSNVASHFYQQLMDKYKNNQEEKKFKDAEKRSMTKEDLAVTKARVKDAIIRQTKNELTPRQRKAEGRTGIGCEGDNEGRRRFSGDPYDPVEERRQAEQAKAATAAEDKRRNAARKLGGPPPPDFATLLKLAEQKQHEPIKVEIMVEKKKQEPERLMTKKEKKEHEARVAFLEMKRLRDRIKEDPKLSPKEKEHKLAKLDALRAAGKLPGIPPSTTTSSTSTVKSTPPSVGQVFHTNGVSCSKPTHPTIGYKGSTSSAKPAIGQTNGSPSKCTEQTIKKQDPSLRRHEIELTRKVPNQQQVLSSSTTLSASSSTVVKNKSSVVNIAAKKSSSSITSSKISKPAPATTANHNCSSKPQQHMKVVGSSSRSNRPQQTAGSMISTISKQPPTMSGKVADVSSSPVSISVKQVPKATITGASTKNGESVRNLATNRTRSPFTNANRREVPRTGQTRQFPPADVHRSKQPRQNMDRGQPMHRLGGSAPKKRRVIDSDSEYDSEMDDFIDDGDCEEDYSSAIKEIFGYDKSRYRDDDYDEDDYNMESSYAQQMREEYISKKIGIMEDLEDMRMEEEEKRRKLKKGSAVKKK
ncbi:protein SPT2 homolog [Anopheles albimanus]|uniref:Protein SPT2 homolog n=1 Tax=Anopheles albimanus TaxID=7167 RepID=A0A182FZU8_ANOAL|nr:protein SPT2 homolog [Anopheles albimanus]XP_035784631.1 protein SPT2 homolog [Anopheles albimanus]